MTFHQRIQASLTNGRTVTLGQRDIFEVREFPDVALPNLIRRAWLESSRDGQTWEQPRSDLNPYLLFGLSALTPEGSEAQARLLLDWLYLQPSEQDQLNAIAFTTSLTAKEYANPLATLFTYKPLLADTDRLAVEKLADAIVRCADTAEATKMVLQLTQKEGRSYWLRQNCGIDSWPATGTGIVR